MSPRADYPFPLLRVCRSPRAVVTVVSAMNTILQAGGRSIEEFIGRSDRGDFNEALGHALDDAKRQLGSESLKWRMLSFSGITAPGQRSAVVVTINAKIATEE